MKAKRYTPIADPKFILALENTEVGEAYQLLSDHAYQVQQITPHDQLLIWNIMTRGNSNNNGFGLREREQATDQDLYLKRLRRITKRLAKQIYLHPEMTVIALQEVPSKEKEFNYFINAFNEALSTVAETEDELKQSTLWIIDSDNMRYKPFENNKFGVMSLFRRQSCLEILGEAEIEGLTTQRGRVLAIDMLLKHQSKLSPLRLVNAHFKFCLSREDTEQFKTEQVQREIDVILTSHRGQVIIAGDLNHDIDKLSQRNNQPPDLNYKHPFKCTSFSRKDNGIFKHNIDGFIFKYNPNL